MSETNQGGPVVKVAQDLREIERLAADLAEQAEDKSTDKLMPGGLATVALAPVANLEAWGHRYEAAEEFGRDTSYVLDEDDHWEPPLQTLCFWSEAWRIEHGAEYDQRPTIASEANFLRWCLEWAWENEVKWDDFADDIEKAKTRLENILKAGERSERGVPCMYDECRGVRLVRKLIPARADDGGKTWKLTDWHCPRCKRSWDEDAYWRNVRAANLSAQEEVIDGERWVTPEAAAREIGRSVKTVRTWINRSQVAVACIIRGRRTKFVSLVDVERRHEDAKRRRERAA